MADDNSEKQFFLSGELARLAGVSRDTLRHYERKGVLPPPGRLRNGYRCYPSETLERVQLVRRALTVGFTLDELARFLKARNRGEAPCQEVRALAGKKLSAVESRLSELQMLREELRATLKDWDQRLSRQGSGQRARLLEALGRRPAGGLTTNTFPRAQMLRKKDK